MKPDHYYWKIGRMLEKLYESEINFSLGWMWDGGVDYKIGADLSYLQGKVESTGITDMGEALDFISAEIAKLYPNSEFAKWVALVNSPMEVE